MRMKQWLMIMLVLVGLLITLLPTAVFADNVIDSGYCGFEDDYYYVKWKVTDDGTLTIFGRGEMEESRITGYQIQLATDKKFSQNKKTVTVKGYKKGSKKVRKLEGGKRYYVKIRTYKTIHGENFYSKWSDIRTVMTKK